MKVVLAGTGSAVGKTTISTGIMKALSKENNVQAFKVGPDFIDPSYHTIATGNISRNLDSFFMNKAQIINLFKRAMKKSNADMAIIEGVRGLYEGISPVGDIGNTASVAKALDAPVVLLMDARSLVKSAAAIVLGFKSLDPDIRIEGVILNKVKGDRHYKKAKEAVEKLTGVQVIGGIPRNDKIAVEERHLGLVPALEKERISNSIGLWGNIVEEYVDLDALKNIMKISSKDTIKNNINIAIESVEDDFNKNSNNAINLPVTNSAKVGELWKSDQKSHLKIAVAKDEIFSFYYQENIEALEDNNAKIIYFSPYNDYELPDSDGLYIGGGYPEVFKKDLSNNNSMLKSIKDFHDNGFPIYGECGGLIYLSKSIDNFNMVNAIPYSSEMTSKVQGLNYIVSEANQDNLISQKGDIFRGHEFHYTKLNLDSNAHLVFNILRGRGSYNKLDGISVGNTLANYIHIHACSCPNFAYNFTKNIVEY